MVNFNGVRLGVGLELELRGNLQIDMLLEDCLV